jgi:DNA-directed RNA polymerase specialized sigma24 family protein
MRTLDDRLYAWLAQGDDRRFERDFSAYFAVAFPAVTRYLARVSQWDSAPLEDLAQEALLKFFAKAGRGRREAAQAIDIALSQIHPLNLGPLHEHRLQHWTKDVASFRHSAMSFRLPMTENGCDTDWKAAVRELADRIPTLQRRGHLLIYAVGIDLHWPVKEEGVTETQRTDQFPELADEGTDEFAASDAAPDDSVQKHLVERMLADVMAQSPQAIGSEKDLPGVMLFCGNTFTVIRFIPRLRVPTNSYLFEIAMSLYLDECKKQGRQKRGGAGGSASERLDAARDVVSQHPLELMSADGEFEFEGQEATDDAASASVAVRHSARFAAVCDPTEHYENEQFLEKFYEYLRKPLDNATEAYQKARATGRAAAEHHKLRSLTKKFSRTIAVLSMIGEGYTQEEIAERLCATRNQVKYIVELVQEAYREFGVASAKLRAAPSSLGDQPHVP